MNTAPTSYALTLLSVMVALTCAPSMTYAQETQEAEVTKIVIMTAPVKGTRTVARAMNTLPSTKALSQKWFNKQVKRRGLSPKRIFKKSKDVKWFMERAGVSLIIRFKQNPDDKSLMHVGLVTQDKGEVAQSFEVSLSSKGRIDADGADAIKSEVSTLLKARYAPEEKPDTPAEQPDKPDPEEPSEPEATTESTATTSDDQDMQGPPPKASPWLHLHAGARFSQREFTAAGRNGAVLRYGSAFYPGYRLKVDARPAKDIPLGLHVEFSHNFDGFTATDQAGTVFSFPVQHIRGEAALGYDLRTEKAHMRVGVLGRWTAFVVGPNPTLPNTSYLSVAAHAKASYALHDVLTLGMYANLAPAVLWFNAKTQFGQDAQAYGFDAGIELGVNIIDALKLEVGYNMESIHTNFTGASLASFDEPKTSDVTRWAHVGFVYSL